MPLTPCLSGPAFSITGDAYFGDNQVNFQVTFDQPADHENVLAYQWYLDECLLTDQQSATLNDKISCGEHRLGLRILSSEGWSGIKTIQFVTCKAPTSVILSGAESVNEGSTARYAVLQLFSDGSNNDITSQYTLVSSAGGSFDGPVFTALDNASAYDDIEVTISASKSGAETLTKQVKVVNTTPIAIVSLEISGPADVDNGNAAVYGVTGHYSDGSQRDISDEFVFASTEGYFTGRTYTASINGIIDEVRTVTISALQNGFVKVSKQINVHIDILKAGILVVDFYQDTTLNAIGLIDNATVVGHHVAAYAGSNIVPAGSTPEQALILASDLNVPSSTNWRFEFNIDKLIRENPGTSDFVFYVKGRSAIKGTVSGAFGLKTRGSKMAFNGNPGSYMPTVIGGANIGPIVNFNNQVAGGANGNFDENGLSTIIRFNYHVPTATLTYTLPPPQIEVEEFDFMAVRYHWEQGAGSDLDILVGFENTGTVHDQVYVGFGQGNLTVPKDTEPESDAYLWWATDNTGAGGYEGVLLGMKAFVDAFPNSTNIVEVSLYASWFGSPTTGDFSVELVTYKGGAMSKVGTDFVNTGGVQVSSNVLSVNTRIKAQVPENVAGYYKVGTLRYNKATASAVIEINSSENSPT